MTAAPLPLLLLSLLPPAAPHGTRRSATCAAAPPPPRATASFAASATGLLDFHHRVEVARGEEPRRPPAAPAPRQDWHR